MRSAPRWIAGASGVDWRSAPSLKCAPSIATGGNRNGTAELAIRWSRPIVAGAPRRPARSQPANGREVSTKATDSPRVSEVALIASESGDPAAIDRRRRAKSMLRASSVRSGALSRSARGTGSSQPPETSARARCRPERSMSRVPARNTWPTRNPPQTRDKLGRAPPEVVRVGARGPPH